MPLFFAIVSALFCPVLCWLFAPERFLLCERLRPCCGWSAQICFIPGGLWVSPTVVPVRSCLPHFVR